MCGIAGILSASRVDRSVLERMTNAVAHRGPDDLGIWVNAETTVGFGHRRLAILDLSPAGHQPMISADRRFVLTFNGEIYNHAELRRELDDIHAFPLGGWRGHSDTEVLLQGIVTWGLAETLRRSAGMFAFALWDERNRHLHLVRDRFGEKPLYYGWAGRDLVFGSELKALRAHPQFDAPINRVALRLLAARAYIPAPFSIYEGVFKLPPASVLTIRGDRHVPPLKNAPTEGGAGGVSLEYYWSYLDVIGQALQDPITDETEALDELERVLARAISGQSMADVPVGAFLSGGIDSSTICALYQKYSATPVRTFSIGFEEADYNEAEDAKRVASYLGTVHDERYVTVKEAREIIPLLPRMYDEPFADSSQIPTHLVSRFAREQVTVALTGDGGDELFAGYDRHLMAPRVWRQLRRIPQPFRAALGGPFARLPASLWDNIFRAARRGNSRSVGVKIRKGLRLGASARCFQDVYSSLFDEWGYESSPVLGEENPNPTHKLEMNTPDITCAMYWDAMSYLPDDILAKVDRASMAVGLETRVPFLDHRVAELAARIPLALKIQDGRGKNTLRRLLYGFVPPALVDRPKSGFGVPVGKWIKGPLRPWAEDLLDPSRLRRDGWFNADVVGKRWQQHLTGERDSTAAIWAILMFQSWLTEQQSPLQNVESRHAVGAH